MTNQEINQVYWTLPKCYRDALDLCLQYGHKYTAADVIRNLSSVFGLGLIEAEEARDWAVWRSSLGQGGPALERRRQNVFPRQG